MKKIAFFVLGALLFTLPAFAEKVRVYTDYSPVRILRLVDKNTNFENEAGKAGLSGNFKEIDESKIPQDRAERDAWKLLNGSISVDANLRDKLRAKKESHASAIEKLKTLGLDEKEIAALGLKGDLK